MIDLKPCPFCGREPKVIEAYDHEDGRFENAQIKCEFCHITIYGADRVSCGGWSLPSDRDHSLKVAVMKWNRRIGDTNGADS
jgi:hypothetical protein